MATEHEQRLAAGQACLEAALHVYLPHGFSVTCCCDPDHVGVYKKHGKECQHPGKTPMHPWKEHQGQRPTAAKVEGYWRDYPLGNVGCVLGQVSGLVRVDVDGAPGEAALEDWSQGELPDTWEFRSSAEGRGLLYQWDQGQPCHTVIKSSADGEHTELRLMGNGSQTVLPPSRHESGSVYAWVPGHSPDDLPIAPAPTWLVARMTDAPRPERQPSIPHDAPTGDYAAELLSFVPNPGADRDRWCEVGMSLHSTGADWAYDLWDTWSQQYPEKYSASDQAKVWKSFSLAGPNGKAPITFGTLVHLARQGGYQSVPAWTKSLLTLKNGEAKETFNNLTLALEHLPPWNTECWYDVARDCGMVGTARLNEPQVWTAARAIEPATSMPIRNLKLVLQALRSRCHQYPRDGLQEWLGALPPWDGVERLTEWLCDHAGVRKTAYTMAVSRLLPVSMVARALHPGIQCRSVVIFEGKQDIGKSELVKRLAGEAWYRIVDSTLEGKEAHMLMKGVWIVELAEMDVMLRTEESRVKSFVTMCNDEYVPKYANDPVKLARRTILVGTINPEGDGSYLRDQTGATRYYPVRVDAIDLDAIAATRDQLFAEALVWFRDHHTSWWQMPEDAKEELAITREARRKEGVFEGPRLREWLDKVRKGTTDVLAPFHTEDALRFGFQIPPERWSASIKDQMGKAIAKYDWESKPSRARGPLQRLWHYVGSDE